LKTVFKVAGYTELSEALSGCCSSLPKEYIKIIAKVMMISLDGHLNIEDDIVIAWYLSDDREYLTVEVEVGGLY
jgi:hypothetical protein